MKTNNNNIKMGAITAEKIEGCSQLRVGNLVKVNSQYLTICKIERENAILDNGVKLPLNMLSPVVVTGDLLNDYGFAILEQEFEHNRCLIMGLGFIKVYIRPTNTVVDLFDVLSNRPFKPLTYQISGFHELQNLYRLFYGKDLKLKKSVSCVNPIPKVHFTPKMLTTTLKKGGYADFSIRAKPLLDLMHNFNDALSRDYFNSIYKQIQKDMEKETADKGAKRLLTAKEARKIADCNTSSRDLYQMLEIIEKLSKGGKQVLHYYEPLSQTVIDQLEALGYQIAPASSIATQKDGLYHSIHW